MKIAQEEIFGPVLAALRFESLEEAVQKANATSYGLAAGIWTKDVKKAHAFAKVVKAGTVWINTYGDYDAAAPFGGYKMSGFGRDLGKAALDSYTQLKTVWVNLG
jgi:acyl-CoA reductase-like NAD-dependent aldehyde dehydrogenase